MYITGNKINYWEYIIILEINRKEKFWGAVLWCYLAMHYYKVLGAVLWCYLAMHYYKVLGCCAVVLFSNALL